MKNQKLSEKEAYLVLNMIPGLGLRTKKLLLERFLTPLKALHAPSSELKKIPRIRKETIEHIINYKQKIKYKNELEKVKKQNITLLTLKDNNYPENLKNIYDPPIVLYTKGTLKSQDSLSIAIVGSRRTSIYGKEIAEKLSFELARYGITIVSGMARGIDTASHKGALMAGGRTIAVLGSGLNVIYPPENKKTYNEIISSGAVLSEFPLDTPPYKTNFPCRNRIISGLSLGVVIIEAAQKSGSLITAQCALEQGREVYALPGKINSPTSMGTNQLIKEGAKLITKSEDILEDLMPLLKNKISLLKKDNSSNINLSDEEQKIIQIITEEPIHIDILSKKLSIPTHTLLSKLMHLELKKAIKQLPGKYFIKK
jgi:DNA processing protein